MAKESFKALVSEASALLTVSKQLDYLKIIEHDVSEIAKLHAYLKSIGAQPILIKSKVSAVDSLPAKVKKPATIEPVVDKEAEQAARMMQIVEHLTTEGFSERLGRVYNSRAEQRSIEFRKVSHRKNLPAFDMIIAADYAPGAGLHAILVSEHHVMSAFLAFPEDQNEWQVLKRRPYHEMSEMVEYVTLLSAGFDIS